MSKHSALGSFPTRIRAAGVRLLVVALAVTSLTASVWAWLAPAGKAEQPAAATKAESSQLTAPTLPSSEQERVEAETITLNSGGFEPAEIRRPAGRFLLAVNDLSGLDGITLRLEGEGGQALQEVSLSRRRQKWRKVVDLTAGAYALTVAGRPEWRCQIFIY